MYYNMHKHKEKMIYKKWFFVKQINKLNDFQMQYVQFMTKHNCLLLKYTLFYLTFACQKSVTQNTYFSFIMFKRQYLKNF